jgi:N-acetylglucosamine-6-sulfatase
VHPAAGVPPSAAAAPTPPPNIVLVLTDDQRWDTLWSQADLVDHGTTFTQAFVENPLCCPSRVTILTGQLSHTTGIYGNGNGFAKFRASGLDRSTIATWLHAAGYRTALTGKYVNGYCAADAAYVPPGWDRWLVFTGPAGACGQGGYYGYTLSNNGRRQSIPATGPYSTDYLAEKAVSFIRGTGASRPLFLMLSTKTPIRPTRRPGATRVPFRACPRTTRRASTRPTCPTSRHGCAPWRRGHPPRCRRSR